MDCVSIFRETITRKTGLQAMSETFHKLRLPQFDVAESPVFIGLYEFTDPVAICPNWLPSGPSITRAISRAVCATSLPRLCFLPRQRTRAWFSFWKTNTP